MLLEFQFTLQQFFVVRALALLHLGLSHRTIKPQFPDHFLMSMTMKRYNHHKALLLVRDMMSD